MKELLDLLEERVASLLVETHTLRQENERLRRELQESAAPLAEENTTLRAALTEERSVRETAVQRIDALLHRIAAQTTE